MAACRGGTITVTGNPQGGTGAPVGTIATNGICWWQKLFGGNTPFGWYPMHNPFMSGNYFGTNLARASSGANPVILGIGSANGLAGSSGGGSVIPQNGDGPETSRKIVALRTGSANPSHAFVRIGTIATVFDGTVEQSTPSNDFPWDLVTVVRTTARAPAATATDLNDIRLWSGAHVGTLTDLVIGGIGDSDTMVTAFATQYTAVNAGSYGAAFRFSTVAADGAWVVVTTNDNGAAFSQTVTALPGITGAIAANTYYRLRLRYVTSPARRIFASVNDQAEVEISANVGPGPNSGSLGMLAFKPSSVVTCKTALASKSLGWTKTTWWFGDC
jgi:hypothetical protein